MSELAELQRSFRDYLVLGKADVIQPLIDNRVNRNQRLGIYANAYKLRLKEALATDYTLLAAWLGEERFDAMAEHYIHAYPSRHYNIRRYGHLMADFLASTGPWCGQPLLTELAAFEWLQGLSFDARDIAPIGIDTLAALPAEYWGGLRFRFHPSLNLRDFHWNANQLWAALKQGKAFPEPRYHSLATTWLFWRKGRSNVFTSLDVEQAKLIDLARSGADFATLCEVLGTWYDNDEAPARAAAILKGWVEEQLVIGI